MKPPTPWCESWGLRMTYLARSEVSIYTSTVVFSTCRLRAEAKKSKTKQTISKLRLTLPLIFKSIWVHILERETQYKTHEKPLYIKQYTVRTITQMTTKNQSLFIYLYDSLCMSKSKVTIQKDSQIHLVPVEPFGRCESVRHLPDLTCRLMVSREFWRYKSAWNNRTFREQDKSKNHNDCGSRFVSCRAAHFLLLPLPFCFFLELPESQGRKHTSYSIIQCPGTKRTQNFATLMSVNVSFPFSLWTSALRWLLLRPPEDSSQFFSPISSYLFILSVNM